MQETFQNARNCLLAAQERWKANLNPGRGDVKFVKGDKVLLSTKNLKLKNDHNVVARHKLLPKYIGPYVISECIGASESPTTVVTAYRLKLPATTRIHNVFHVSVLRKFKESPEGLDESFFPAPLDWLEPDPLFAVESIF